MVLCSVELINQEVSQQGLTKNWYCTWVQLLRWYLFVQRLNTAYRILVCCLPYLSTWNIDLNITWGLHYNHIFLIFSRPFLLFWTFLSNLLLHSIIWSMWRYHRSIKKQVCPVTSDATCLDALQKPQLSPHSLRYLKNICNFLINQWISVVL